jgi:hypothetical protein
MRAAAAGAAAARNVGSPGAVLGLRRLQDRDGGIVSVLLFLADVLGFEMSAMLNFVSDDE